MILKLLVQGVEPARLGKLNGFETIDNMHSRCVHTSPALHTRRQRESMSKLRKASEMLMGTQNYVEKHITFKYSTANIPTRVRSFASSSNEITKHGMVKWPRYKSVVGGPMG